MIISLHSYLIIYIFKLDNAICNSFITDGIVIFYYKNLWHIISNVLALEYLYKIYACSKNSIYLINTQ